MPDKPRHSPARLLAPLALVLFVVALLAVLGGSGTGDSASSDVVSPPAEPAATEDTTTSEAPRPRRRRMYVVKAGDNLDVIAEKTGVPTDTLEELNPELDPFALDIGQKITLRE